MRYFSPSLWQEVSFPALQKKLQAANGEDILLSYYVLSFIVMYTAVWIRPFKHAHVVFVFFQLAILLCLDAAINWCFIDSLSDNNSYRAVYIVYLAFFNYISFNWVQHCVFEFAIRVRLTDEEKAKASAWKRFWYSRFFLNRFTMGSGRWHTYIGTDSWRMALFWRLSVPLLVSLAGIGSGIGFTHPNVLIFGTIFGLADLATVCWRKEPTTSKDVDSLTSVSETETLLEKEKIIEV